MSYQVITSLPNGALVFILAETSVTDTANDTGVWYKVRGTSLTGQQVIGWMHSDIVKPE